jgi:hypothetical protein
MVRLVKSGIGSHTTFFFGFDLSVRTHPEPEFGNPLRSAGPIPSLVEPIPWNLFLDSLNVYKFGPWNLWVVKYKDPWIYLYINISLSLRFFFLAIY